MNIELQTAIIGALGVIIGSVIVGFVTYATNRQHKILEKKNGQLIKCWEDIEALHHLETLYTDQLANLSGQTAESWKKRIRKTQFEVSSKSPSEDATQREAARKIAYLRQ